MSRSSYFILAPIALMWTLTIVAVILPRQDSRQGLEAALVLGSVAVGAISGFVLVSFLRRVRSRLTKTLSVIGYVISVSPSFGLAGQWLEGFDFTNGSLAIATLNFAVIAIIPLTVGTLAGLFVGVVISGVAALIRSAWKG